MRSNDTVLHVINHTHWDREWFVPFTFTRSWIPQLIDNLGKVVADNPKYKFLFDAQTMVIEDLEAVDKDSYKVARELIRNKNLDIGPYYGQLDMRMSGPESLVRNLRVGIDKTKKLGGSTEFTAWGVDIFGHVSQSPQIYNLFGIKDVYLWRGPDQLEPFFWWEGADGSTMLAVNLFAGGYRNFYKVTVKPDLALPRLEHEVSKLRPYYPLGHIPVFDGYDLDSEPGDAATYFAANHADYLAKKGIKVVSSSPSEFAEETRKAATGLPTLSGELISGKYSSVFPGTLSSRVYSKLLIGHAESLLYRYAEPLSSLLPVNEYPEKLFEDQSKLILQNLVHDVIAGCSIDQVHQIAELRVQKLDGVLKDKTAEAITSVASSLEDGTYAYLPATGKIDSTVAHNGKLYRVAGRGVSITKVTDITKLPSATRDASEFSWKNQHFESKLYSDGSLEIDGSGQFGQLVVRKEEGDTYWDEPRGDVLPLVVKGPLRVCGETDEFAQVSFTAAIRTDDYSVEADVTLTFDDSPLVKWRVKLSSQGSGFSVLLRNDYGASLSKLNVGMQFDNVVRDFEDTSLLGQDIDPLLASVLNGFNQRDLYQTFTFPFHSYISPVLLGNKVHLLAKSLRAYQTERPGNVDLVLLRAVDWVMKLDAHEYHSGDAGPKYYVPDARSERETIMECALLVSESSPDDAGFHQAVDQYICAPLLFKVDKSMGTESQISMMDEPVIISSLHQYKGVRLARVYNPSSQALQLRQERAVLGPDNSQVDKISELAPKSIAAVSLTSSAAATDKAASLPRVTLINWPEYPVAPDNSKPDPGMIAQLRSMHETLKRELDTLAASIEEYNGKDAPHSLQHRYYVTARECMEAKLSLMWNKRRLEQPAVLNEDYAAGADKELQQLAVQYNDLRVMRRMYDYIVGISADDLPIARPAHHRSTEELESTSAIS